MLTVGVLTRGKYGKRLLDTLAAHTPRSHQQTYPQTLPDFIDEPAPGRVLYPCLALNGPEPGDNPYQAIQGGRMLLPGSKWN
jgi:hypothetical protein